MADNLRSVPLAVGDRLTISEAESRLKRFDALRVESARLLAQAGRTGPILCQVIAVEGVRGSTALVVTLGPLDGR